MEVVVVEEQEGTELKLIGDFDIYAVSEVYRLITKAVVDVDSVTLDLSEVGHIDGAGIQLLMALKGEFESQKKPFHLVGHSDSVIEAIELCHLERFFGDPLILKSGM